MSGSIRGNVAAAVLALLSAGACGQAADDAGAEDAARQEYIEQAGEVCRGINEDFNALFETDFPTIRSRSDEFFAKAAPLIEERMRQLRALDIPEGDEDEINSMLDSGDKAVADFERAAQDEQLAGELFSQEGSENSLAFEDKAEAYGIEECAPDEGGDEDEEPAAEVDPSAFSPEKRAYVESVDAICRTTDARLAPVEQTVFAEFPPTAQAWRQGLPQLVPIIRSQLEGIKAESPPDADRQAVDAILQKQDELAMRLDEALAAANSGDDNRLADAIEPVFRLFDEVDQAYREFGFQVCGALDEEGEDGEAG